MWTLMWKMTMMKKWAMLAAAVGQKIPVARAVVVAVMVAYQLSLDEFESCGLLESSHAHTLLL